MIRLKDDTTKSILDPDNWFIPDIINIETRKSDYIALVKLTGRSKTKLFTEEHKEVLQNAYNNNKYRFYRSNS